MKKEYVKPEMVMEEFISEICFQPASGGDTDMGGGESDLPLDANDRRGGWGDLWN